MKWEMGYLWIWKRDYSSVSTCVDLWLKVMKKNEIILLVILAVLIGIYIGSVDYLSKIIISNFG